MKEAKYSPAEKPELVDILVKAIGRYLCSRACDYAGAERKVHYTLDTEDLSDVFMIDEQWLEDHKPDIYFAAWHDPLFLRYIKHGSEFTKTGIFTLDVAATIDDEYLSDMSDDVYERMETLIDIWVKFMRSDQTIDIDKLRMSYEGVWNEDYKLSAADIRMELKCTLMARKLLLVAAVESDDESGKASIGPLFIDQPWFEGMPVEEFSPYDYAGKVSRAMSADVFLSKYLLLYGLRDFDEEKKTISPDILIRTELASWGDYDHPEDTEADCRYRDANDNYMRALRSFRMVDYTGTYEEVVSIYNYLNTPSEMVNIFNRTDQEKTYRFSKEEMVELNKRVETIKLDQQAKRKKNPADSGRYIWHKAGVELKKKTETMDPVNHPVHYADSCSLECIDLMEFIFGRLDNAFPGFLLGNAFKYIWRHKKKGGLEDLEKAEWYLEKFDELDLCDEDFAHIREWLENKIEKARRDY